MTEPLSNPHKFDDLADELEAGCESAMRPAAAALRAAVTRKAEAERAVLSMLWLPGVRAALDALPPGDGAEPQIVKAAREERDALTARADAAEARIKALTEALREIYAECDAPSPMVAARQVIAAKARAALSPASEEGS